MIRISALITESAIESGLILTLTESDDIVNIVGARNITNENDKLILSVAKLVALKLHVLGNDRKQIMVCTMPLVKFVLEGNCKHVNEYYFQH